MRALLVACGLLLGAVGLGVLIGLTSFRAGPAENTLASVEEKAIPAPEPSARLHLPGVAVVDLSRLVAAHPWTAGHEEIFAEKISQAQSWTDTQEQAAARRIAEIERRESRRLVVNDIQRAIAAYAATNDLRLVLDRSAPPAPARSVVEYSSNGVEFLDITDASGVRDITQDILQLLASERPSNGIHWTRR